MQLLDGQLVHSVSDLNAFTECLHLVALERNVAIGADIRPEREDLTAELLARKGNEHEARHHERLRDQYGDRLVAFEERPTPSRAGYEAAQTDSTRRCRAARMLSVRQRFLTTSNAELAPRGLEFLLNPNRLNVAVSRAQALSIVVCSPQLLASRASTIDNMRLLNLLCAYVEKTQSSSESTELTPRERRPTPAA